MENIFFSPKSFIIINKAKKGDMRSAKSGFPNFWPVSFATIERIWL